MSTSIEQQPTSPSSLNNEQTPSDDFVLVSPSNSFEQSSESIKARNASLGDTASSKFTSESHREDDIMENVIALGKENDRLKETIQHNNSVLQKYIKDFTEMQEAHKANNENVKREHQRAKEVVQKLRDDNRTLSEELKSAQLQASQGAIKSCKAEDLEEENAYMKHQINSLQQRITTIDEEVKEGKISESFAENWQQLLGSLASYSYKAGISQRNEKSLANEMKSEDEQKYSPELETENEILRVDIEKVKVEKQYIVGKLTEVKEELSNCKTSCRQLKEEKEEIRKMLDEQCEMNLKKDREHTEVMVVNQNLQEDNQKLNEELQNTKEELFKKTEEYRAKIEDAEMEQKVKSEDGVKDEFDDDLHDICKQKFLAMQMQYFNLQKQVNNMEERENSLCAKEKAFEKEKSQIQQQVLETRKLLAAELESHQKSFIEKTNQLHSELEEARDREESLQEQLLVVQQQAEYSEKEESLREQVCQLIKENDAMRVKIEKLKDLNSRRDRLYEERMKDLEKQRKEKDKENISIMDMLQNQLGAAKEDRKKYQEQAILIRNEHDRLACQHEQLMKEYDELLNSFNGTLEENKMRNSTSVAEIESYKGKMDDFATHFAAAQEACHKKDTQIHDLQERLRMAEAQKNEEVPVLKQQMDAYYDDFRAEREARERQHADLLNLQQQNQRLVEANRELQRELDNLQDNQQMAEMQRRHVSHHGSGHINPEAFRAGFHTRRGREPEQLEDYEWSGENQRAENRPHNQEQQRELEEPINCPGCGQEFWSFSAGEQHVVQCQAALQQNRQPINDNQCPLCGNEYPDQDTLEIHVQECLRDAQ